MKTSETVRARMEAIMDLLQQAYPSGMKVTNVVERLGLTRMKVDYAVRKLGERIEADDGWLSVPRAERDALWAAEVARRPPPRSPFGYSRFDLGRGE